jgi:hypothetical protein
MSTPEGLQLMRAFTQIKNAKLRRSIVHLVNAMVASEGDSERSS